MEPDNPPGSGPSRKGTGDMSAGAAADNRTDFVQGRQALHQQHQMGRPHGSSSQAQTQHENKHQTFPTQNLGPAGGYPPPGSPPHSIPSHLRDYFRQPYPLLPDAPGPYYQNHTARPNENNTPSGQGENPHGQWPQPSGGFHQGTVSNNPVYHGPVSNNPIRPRGGYFQHAPSNIGSQNFRQQTAPANPTLNFNVPPSPVGRGSSASPPQDGGQPSQQNFVQHDGGVRQGGPYLSPFSAGPSQHHYMFGNTYYPGREDGIDAGQYFGDPNHPQSSSFGGQPRQGPDGEFLDAGFHGGAGIGETSQRRDPRYCYDSDISDLNEFDFGWDEQVNKRSPAEESKGRKWILNLQQKARMPQIVPTPQQFNPATQMYYNSPKEARAAAEPYVFTCNPQDDTIPGPENMHYMVAALVEAFNDVSIALDSRASAQYKTNWGEGDSKYNELEVHQCMWQFAEEIVKFCSNSPDLVRFTTYNEDLRKETFETLRWTCKGRVKLICLNMRVCKRGICAELMKAYTKAAELICAPHELLRSAIENGKNNLKRSTSPPPYEELQRRADIFTRFAPLFNKKPCTPEDLWKGPTSGSGTTAKKARSKKATDAQHITDSASSQHDVHDETDHTLIGGVEENLTAAGSPSVPTPNQADVVTTTETLPPTPGYKRSHSMTNHQEAQEGASDGEVDHPSSEGLRRSKRACVRKSRTGT